MNRKWWLITVPAVALVGVAGFAVLNRGERAGAPRWHSSTIGVEPEALRELPEPLARLGDRIERRIAPAPQDRGSELSVRWNDSATPRDEDALRLALREAKALVEVGFITSRDPQPTGHRSATLTGLVLERAAERSAPGGVR